MIEMLLETTEYMNRKKIFFIFTKYFRILSVYYASALLDLESRPLAGLLPNVA